MSENRGIILVVEDEDHIADLLHLNLEMEDYEVVLSPTGLPSIDIVKSRKIDLVLMDVMLPDANGVDLCRQIKNIKSDLPVLMLSALGQSSDRIKGLKSGADDYLSKPFNLEELLLRIEKLILRYGESSPTTFSSEMTIGSASVDFSKMTLSTENNIHRLTQKEAALLKYMIEKKNTVISRQSILEEVWGYEQYPNTRTIDNFISNFRKLIEVDHNNPQCIKTIRGVGYMLEV